MKDEKTTSSFPDIISMGIYDKKKKLSMEINRNDKGKFKLNDGS